MLRISRCIVVFAGMLIFVAFTGSLVFAIFPKLQTTLSGLAVISGQVPEGEARVDQSGVPTVPGQLQVQVEVNLPAGTPLDVILRNTKVGTIMLIGGKGELSTALPFQVGRLDPIFVNSGVITILSGGAPWKVSSEFLEQEPPEG